MASDVKTWYNGLPPCTRIIISASVGIPLLMKFGLVNPYYLISTPETVFQKLQVRRKEKDYKGVANSDEFISKPGRFRISNGHILQISLFLTT
jgi:hypothetical protein